MVGFVLVVGVVVVVVRPFRLAGLKLAVFVDRCMRSFFARVGWRSMSMVDLQRAALAEALRLRSVGVSGNVYLPSVLEVSLSEPDWVVVDRASEFFIGEVGTALRDQAEEQGWAVGVITITLVLEPGFAPGRVDVSEVSKVPVVLYPAQQPLTVRQDDILVSGPPRTIAMDEIYEVEAMPKTQMWPGLSLMPVSDGLPTIGASSADNEIVVGRLDTSDRVVDSPIVSAAHFILRRNNLGWTCTDLGSKNGTLVNNKRADTQVVLKARDRIRIGAMHCWEVALPA